MASEDQRLISESQNQPGRRWRITLVFHSSKGVCLALLAGVLVAFNNTLAVLLTNIGIPVYQILLYMYAGGLILIAPLVVIMLGLRSILADTAKQRMLLVSIGVLYTIADICQILALSMIPIGNVTAIYRGTMPIVTPILARIVLKEPFTKIQAFNTAFCLAGILLAAQPTVIFGEPATGSDVETSDDWLGYLLSITCGAAFSVTYVTGAMLADVNVLVINLYENFIGSLINAFIVFVFTFDSVQWHMQGSTVGLFIGLIVTFVIAFIFRFRSVQIEAPTTVVLLVNFQIVIAYLADYVFFDLIPNIYDIFATCLIIFSSAFVAIATSYSNAKEQRNKCSE